MRHSSSTTGVRPDAAGVCLRIYVSPDGDDDASGGSPATAFASLQRAQEAVRCADAHRDITAVLSEGTYHLQSPLEFGVEDGGRGTRTVTWQAAAGSNPVLSGGRRVENWRIYGDGIWIAELHSRFDFRQLYVNGSQAPRAGVVVDAGGFV